MDDTATLFAEVEVVVVAVAAIIMAVVGWVLVRAILRAAEYAPAAMVTVALSLLTLVALIGFIVTESDVLGTVAATGVGALAGSVTAMFTDQGRSRRDSVGDEPSEEER